ncbi:MAG: MerR family transcriptional regulator [Coriobacteriia bacterium]|nr:MerR family transcriptional regulator [Coriobacteriia bacterium]
MDYSIRELAQLGGVSTRTLRYYDTIGLLRPAYVTGASYRRYTSSEVDTLQEILFYKELGMDLGSIKSLIGSKDYDRSRALQDHLTQLRTRKEQIEHIIATVEKTIETMKGTATMTDEEKFEGLKKDLLDQNEEQYGDEVRERWGADSYEASRKKVARMTKDQWDDVGQLSNKMHELLKAAVAQGDPASEEAQEVCDLHRQWLGYFWPDGMYSKEMHRNMGQMYCADPRFKKHYDDITPGAAEFFRDAIDIYADE